MLKDGFFVPYTKSESCGYCEFTDICKIYSFDENKYSYLEDFIKIKEGKLEVN